MIKQFLSDATIPPKIRVKTALEINGVKSSDIARELNLSNAAVSRVISGVATSRRITKALSKKLGVDVAQLYQQYNNKDNKSKSKQKGDKKNAKP